VDVERVMNELKLERIRGVPTLLIFNDGRKVERIVGTHQEPEFLGSLREEFSRPLKY